MFMAEYKLRLMESKFTLYWESFLIKCKSYYELIISDK